MRTYWISVGPQSNIPGVLIKRMPCKETDVQTGRMHRKTEVMCQKLGRSPFPVSSEGAVPADTLSLDFSQQAL